MFHSKASLPNLKPPAPPNASASPPQRRNAGAGPLAEHLETQTARHMVPPETHLDCLHIYSEIPPDATKHASREQPKLPSQRHSNRT
ncbi:hypothetical protein CTA1_4458 [Colletotrichum tanaceti]|uniref:Uncharacterized protein n=1 Tax=Colletotrichum tanaceti TaxID=1306861 RepID=A0A4U6WZ11_9PEZI|nr:hypothetical protein CTA1_4458 [Colletotrichum tanaceti]